MRLDPIDLETFAKTGVLIKRGLIAKEHIARAHSIVAEWYKTAKLDDRLNEHTQKTFAPELESHPTILSLIAKTHISSIICELIGQVKPVTKAQIQIRVPESQFFGLQPVKSLHVDGVACPHLDSKDLRTFSLLVGIPLATIKSVFAGALKYIPHGHILMAEWFNSEWFLGMDDQVPDSVLDADEAAFTGDPGDVLFMHHLVPHAVGKNFSPDPRIMVYFRISHVDHANRRLSALRDPFLDFPAVQQFIDRRP